MQTHKESEYPLLTKLGETALQFGADITFKTDHYLDGDRHVCLFRPMVGGDLPVVAVRMPRERTRFSTSKEIVDQELSGRQILICRSRDAELWVASGHLQPYDPWRDEITLKRWREISKSCFATPSAKVRSRAKDIVGLSGASATGKSTLARILGRFPPGTSRAHRAGERRWLDCDDVTDCEVIALGPNTEESAELYCTMFEHKVTLCHFISPVTMEWHFILSKVLEEALRSHKPGEKLFLPGGLDTAELVMGALVCQKQELPARPMIIYNMPAKLETLDRWYTKRGTKMAQKDERLSYDLWNGDRCLDRASYVNVLIGDQQAGFVAMVESII
ncbi:MAG: hypothetical protein Q7S37_03095 [bacterium]|nr:hypothetical protein [bacterium]